MAFSAPGQPASASCKCCLSDLRRRDVCAQEAEALLQLEQTCSEEEGAIPGPGLMWLVREAQPRLAEAQQELCDVKRQLGRALQQLLHAADLMRVCLPVHVHAFPVDCVGVYLCVCMHVCVTDYVCACWFPLKCQQMHATSV